jgi:hypothetical protein
MIIAEKMKSKTELANEAEEAPSWRAWRISSKPKKINKIAIKGNAPKII